jgi:hypothetical protein
MFDLGVVLKIRGCMRRREFLTLPGYRADEVIE